MWGALREWADDVLCAAFGATRAETGGPAAFINSKKKLVHLIMKAEDLQRVLANQATPAAVARELGELSTGSRLGQQLFLADMENLLNSQLGDKLKNYVAEGLMAPDFRLTEDTLVELKDGAMLAMATIAGLDLLPGSRTVVLQYR